MIVFQRFMFCWMTTSSKVPASNCIIWIHYRSLSALLSHMVSMKMTPCDLLLNIPLKHYKHQSVHAFLQAHGMFLLRSCCVPRKKLSQGKTCESSSGKTPINVLWNSSVQRSQKLRRRRVKKWINELCSLRRPLSHKWD